MSVRVFDVIPSLYAGFALQWSDSEGSSLLG